MLKELIKMAGEFDRLGLTKEADKVDAMIRKVGGDTKSTGYDNNKRTYRSKYIDGVGYDPGEYMGINPYLGDDKGDTDFTPSGEGVLDERTPESAMLAAEELDELDWADRNLYDSRTEDYLERDSQREWMQQAEKAYHNRFETNPEDPPQYTGEFADFLNRRTSLNHK